MYFLIIDFIELSEEKKDRKLSGLGNRSNLAIVKSQWLRKNGRMAQGKRQGSAKMKLNAGHKSHAGL